MWIYILRQERFYSKYFPKLLDDLEKRKRLRQKKARDEKRRERRIEIEENKKQGKCKYNWAGHNTSWKWFSEKYTKIHLSLTICLHLCVPSDPEVHIGLENLQHFPAFGSPPHNSSPPIQPDFTFAPPSPLSSSPSAGKSSCCFRNLLCHIFTLIVSRRFMAHDERYELSISSTVLDGMRFPSLNGQSPSPIVGSVEDDSHCMSFAQVCMANTHINYWLKLPLS